MSPPAEIGPASVFKFVSLLACSSPLDFSDECVEGSDKAIGDIGIGWDIQSDPLLKGAHIGVGQSLCAQRPDAAQSFRTDAIVR